MSIPVSIRLQKKKRCRMDRDIILSPIRVLDATLLKDRGFFQHVTDDVTSYIRAVLSDPRKRYFLASTMVNEEKKIIAVLGLANISSIHNSAEMMMFFPSDIQEEEEKDEEMLRIGALDRFMRLAFFDIQIHRISIVIPVTDTQSERILAGCHMRQEALLEEALRYDDSYVDGALFSLLDSEYPDYSVGFVPFKTAVIAIRGDNEVVESTHFLNYGKKVEGVLERNVAIRCGIADANGILKEAGSPEYAELFDLSFPDEVARCMRELAEYFQKRRSSFTIHAKPIRGSDFQKKVWEKILGIPYGGTCSYEDIALLLTGGDKNTAKNLTRAVGAACSDNPLPILVPCHRIIGKDGRLVGFSGGLEIKEFLLNHEMFGIHIC